MEFYKDMVPMQLDESKSVRCLATPSTTSPMTTTSPHIPYYPIDNCRKVESSSRGHLVREHELVSPFQRPVLEINTQSQPSESLPCPVHTFGNPSQQRAACDTSEEYKLAISPAIEASRSDPFNSWPIVCYRDLDQNFNFLVNSFGPSTFGYLPNDRGFDLFRPMIRIALADPAAFHALMIMPVIRKGQLVGQPLPGMNALWHQMEAIRLIKERVESGNIQDCLTEGSIYAVMVLMGISAQWGAVSRDEFDASALNKLVLRKGGLDVIGRSYPVLEMSLFGMSVLNPGLLRSDLYTVNGLTVSIGRDQDVKVLLYSLLGFVRGTIDLRERASSGLVSIGTAFSAGTPARTLLKQPPPHPGILAHQQIKLRRRLMIHIVVYIFTILLWASPTVIQEFIMHLQFVLSNARIWQNSLRLFQWSLGANMSRGTLMFPKQAWQSYELLCAIQCLDEQLQDDILAFYLGLLTLEVDGSSRPEDLMDRIGSMIYENG